MKRKSPRPSTRVGYMQVLGDPTAAQVELAKWVLGNKPDAALRRAARDTVLAALRPKAAATAPFVWTTTTSGGGSILGRSYSSSTVDDTSNASWGALRSSTDHVVKATT